MERIHLARVGQKPGWLSDPETDEHAWQRTTTARYFVDKFRCATVVGAIDEALINIRARMGTEPNTPSFNVGLQRPDLEAAARSVSIQEIRWANEKTLPGFNFAKLIPNHDGFLVLLKWGINMRFRQFALAHEIGHTQFYDYPPKRHMIGILSKTEMGAEERICNMFASALTGLEYPF